MEVIIQPNQEAAAALVARIVARELRANPHLVLGLATGQTMECVYRHLVRLHQTEKLDFSLCRTFNLDEYVGLFPSDPNSYRHYMNHHLFRHVNVDPRNTYLPNGLATDLDEECRRYEATIQRFGGIDLQLLGIGKAGHIGFNEPLSALRSRTRVKALTPTTLKQNAPVFGGEDKMPPPRHHDGRRHHPRMPPLHPARHRRQQGQSHRPGRRRPHHQHDLRHRPPTARPLDRHRGRRSRRQPRREGLLPLDLHQRTRVGRIPVSEPEPRAVRLQTSDFRL